MTRSLILLLSLAATALAQSKDPKITKDPKDGRVSLEAGGGWEASLVIDNKGVGIWTVDSFKVFPQYACPEVVGLDDKGRCHVLVSYSGRWTPFTTVSDGKWLGGLAHGDVDPRIEGAETYVGSQRGNLYQIVAYTHGTLDNRLITHFDGKEIHTIVARDKELLVFTRPGALYRITPDGEHGRWNTTLLQSLPGRVRDAEAFGDAIATVSRNGRLELLRIRGDKLAWELVYQAPMGMGRIAHAGGVLYSTHDDGRILRHARAGENWSTETIYLGPEGPRGIAAGRFCADPGCESVAVFGYSGKVQLLCRKQSDELWKVETLFQDTDKGHWLAVAEVDGRNDTRELLCSGYSGRIVLLNRPAGYGRKEQCGDPSLPRSAATRQCSCSR
jgi:hypothetical protein